MISRALVLTSSGVWVKHSRLAAIERITARGAGGGGSWPAGNGDGYGGGGGAVSFTKRALGEWELPETVEYQVGTGGLGGNATTRNGGDGGDTWFGNFIRVGGAKGATTITFGLGGYGMLRGGRGGLPTERGESVTSGVIAYGSAAGGGSGGSGGIGGASGPIAGGVSNPPFWQSAFCGGGGNQRSAGGYPAGGGGGGNAPSIPAAKGADGLLTIIEYLYEE